LAELRNKLFYYDLIYIYPHVKYMKLITRVILKEEKLEASKGILFSKKISYPQTLEDNIIFASW